MKKVNLKIDNKPIEAQQGQTILQAAKENGIEIPHMCYDPRLDPFTSCWLCIVEVKGFPRLVPSCSAKVAEGMEVFTRAERVNSGRRTCLGLLLSDHYGDCIAPCQAACPDNIDVQGYLALIALGKYREALELIREVNPLPLSVGRVCPRFCERECRRNLVDEPVGINYLKRFASERGYEGIDPSQAIPKNTGYSVAIIGAGSAGLSASHFLRLKGHAVTIFESNPKPGGMMRYGIPGYRLPKKEMDTEIDLILNMGVDVRFGIRFPKDIGIKDLRSMGFDAILLAIGAWSERRLGCDGEDLDGVVSGIGLLYKIAAGEHVTIGKRVSVIGGGNTAIDAARSCLRMGANEVHLIYRRSREEMPALAEEVHEAEQEGVRLHFLSAPEMIKPDGGGRVTAIRCIRMELGEPDASGRRSPLPIEGSEYEFETDTVVAAIGQFMGDKGALEEMGIRLTRRGTVAVESDTMQTNLEGIFAAGDCVTGPATVIESIAGGRRAAGGIDSCLMKGISGNIKKVPYNHSKGDLESIDRAGFESYEKIPRAQMPALAKEERLKGFAEVELGLTEDTAKKEAGRCLSCGCEAVFECKLREYSTQYGLRQDFIKTGKYNRYTIRNEHPFIYRDRNKCIRCGLCVRMCAEVEGASAFGFVGRGFQSIIDPPLNTVLSESTCDSCGLCLSACPTGALAYRPGLTKTGPWVPETTQTVCTLCGLGCRIIIKTKAGYCTGVMPVQDGSFNTGKLCWRGTFGWGMLHDPDRLMNPYRLQGREMAEVDLDKAIGEAGAAINGLVKAHGPQSLAIILSPRLTNEEKILAHNFSEALGVKDIYKPGRDTSIMPLPGFGISSDYKAVLESDFLLCIGSRIVDDYPVASYMIKDAVKKGGTLAIIGTESKRLTSISDIWIDSPPEYHGPVISLLSALAIEKGLLSLARDTNRDKIRPVNPRDRDRLALFVKKGKVEDLISRLLHSERPVLIINSGLVSSRAIAMLFEGIWGKENREGGHPGFLYLQKYGEDCFEGGYTPIEKLEEKVKTGSTKGILAFGHWKGLNRIRKLSPDTLLIQSAVFRHSKACLPDFLFPASLSVESAGSFTNVEGRLLMLSEGITPAGGIRNYELILKLANAAGKALPFAGIEDITKFVQGFKGAGDPDALFEGLSLGDFIDLKGRMENIKPDPDWFEDEIDLYLKERIRGLLFREDEL